MRKDIVTKNSQIEHLSNAIETEYVPKASKDAVEDEMMEVKERLTKVVTQNKYIFFITALGIWSHK
jgi:hypothetical protein